MNTSEWQARWISDANDKDFVPAPMLRRAFDVRSGVKRARLYVSAAAYAKTALNGEPVSGNLLDPGYTHYDKRNLYAVHDVTDRLREGENVLSAVLGNGFYKRHPARRHMEFRIGPLARTCADDLRTAHRLCRRHA